MIILTAALQVVNGSEGEAERILLDLVRETGREEGVREYRFHRTPNEPGSFFFYERYVDQAALDAHLGSAHFQAAVAALGDLLVAEPVLTRHELIRAVPE